METRIHDMEQVVDMMISTLQQKEYMLSEQAATMSKAIDQVSSVLSKCHSSLRLDALESDQETIDKLRKENEKMAELLKDTSTFIRVYSYDLSLRADPFGIRTDPISTLYTRINSVLNSGLQPRFYPSQWTTNDTLLLLQRMVKKELLLLRIQESTSLSSSFSSIESSGISSDLTTSQNSSFISFASSSAKRERLRTQVNPPISRSPLDKSLSKAFPTSF